MDLDGIEIYEIGIYQFYLSSVKYLYIYCYCIITKEKNLLMPDWEKFLKHARFFCEFAITPI